tara:strand:+ start:271 stop:627 length:357 start_codon:yes stop_codon:yes gene_type:complete
MNKIWILLLAAVLSFNAQAADKKAKKPKGNTAYTKLIAELKLSDEQKPKFQALQKEQKAFMAEQKKRSADEKKTAGKPFYKARNAKLKELFTEEQLTQWKAFQAKQRAAREKKAQEKK